MYVVHCKRNSYDIYIGRPSIYGNPWTNKNSKYVVDHKFTVISADKAVENYERWLTGREFTDILQEQRKSILKNLSNLRGKVLGCWCYPEVCHGDVLVWLSNLTNEELRKIIVDYKEIVNE